MQKSRENATNSNPETYIKDDHTLTMTKGGLSQACKIVSTYENQLMSYTILINDKKHTITSIGTEKALDNIQQLFMINTRNRGEHHYHEKGHLRKLTANFTLNDYSIRSTRLDVCSHHFYSILYRKF